MGLSKQIQLEIYHRKKNGTSSKDLKREYGIDEADIKYLVRLVDTHGEGVLSDKKARYSYEFKTSVIEEYLKGNDSQRDVSIRYGLPNSTLIKAWLKQYDKEKCVMLEKKRGRPPMKEKKNNEEKPYDEMTNAEKIDYLQRRNKYLEAENDYLKKLHAVVLTRKAQQQKKK